MTKHYLIHPDLSYKLNGIFFAIHNELGRLRSERQYADFLEERLRQAGVGYEREKETPIVVDGKLIKGNRVDYIIENKIVVELKAKPFLAKSDFYQMLRYLETAGLKLGLIVNFRRKYLRPKRIVNNRIP